MTTGVDKIEQAVDAIIDNMTTVEAGLVMQILLSENKVSLYCRYTKSLLCSLTLITKQLLSCVLVLINKLNNK